MLWPSILCITFFRTTTSTLSTISKCIWSLIFVFSWFYFLFEHQLTVDVGRGRRLFNRVFFTIFINIPFTARKFQFLKWKNFLRLCNCSILTNIVIKKLEPINSFELIFNKNFFDKSLCWSRNRSNLGWYSQLCICQNGNQLSYRIGLIRTNSK